ncbi:MAG: tol-pal system-associated acyl-CoA thioesterase [Parvibaculaceae bacterium]
MTEWKDLAGRLEPGLHVLPVRVYYEDTDFSGAVYHANYLKFCERARSDCLRLLGIHHHEMHWHETEGRMGFVVRRMVCDFLRPARIDDLLEVETRFRDMGGARMELDQKVLRRGEVLFSAAVTVALVDAAGRPKRFPKAMAKILKTF